jgi:hypothetical protein
MSYCGLQNVCSHSARSVRALVYGPYFCDPVAAGDRDTPKTPPRDRNSLHALPSGVQSPPLDYPKSVMISQEYVTDTVKHNKPLCPFAAEPFEGALIASEREVTTAWISSIWLYIAIHF